jgi:hypothetical protein
MATLRRAAAYQAQAQPLMNFGIGSDPFELARAMPVTDQLALTGLQQSGLTDLFSQIIDKPITGQDLAQSMWSSNGWSAPGGPSSMLGWNTLDLLA